MQLSLIRVGVVYSEENIKQLAKAISDAKTGIHMSAHELIEDD